MTTYRTDDPSRWGMGKGANLSATDLDLNFWGLVQDVAALKNSPAQGPVIASAATNGTSLTFTMTDGTTLGPIPMPVLRWKWRGQWAVNTAYAPLDVFAVDGVGLFVVLEANTSGTSFDPSAADASGNPLYLQVFGTLVPFYLSFSVPGTFGDLAPDRYDSNYEIFDVLLPVTVTLPLGLATSPVPGCEVAPVAAVTLTLQQIHNGVATAIGSLGIGPGQTYGAFTLATAVTIPAGDRLRLYAPSNVDTTVAGIFGTIVGTR